MDQLNEYFRQAELALAAYASLSTGKPSQDELIKAGMSPTQADRFARDWRVVDQHTDALSGFSATLFQEIDAGGNPVGEKRLAIRGTNDPIDWFVDWGIFAGTGAVDQYRALEAYYQRLLTTGKLSGGERMSVTGHSLGGFLAQGFAVDYPGAVSQTYTYNAPGLGGLVAEIFQALDWVQPNVPLDNIVNLRAEPGLPATASLGTVLGNIQPVLIEANLNPLHNHSIVTLTDALAIYNLLATLDPNLNSKLADIGELLKAASHQAADTLEATLSALGKLFGKTYPATETSRDTLYVNLYDLQAAAAGVSGLTVRSLTDFTATQMAVVAQDNLAYRYALKNLNPFAVLGADYSPFNQNGELDRYDPATDSGTMSAAYLEDRAKFLYGLLKANGTDTTALTVGGAEMWLFTDHESGAGLTLTPRGITISGAHSLQFAKEEGQRLDGQGGADRAAFHYHARDPGRSRLPVVLSTRGPECSAGGLPLRPDPPEPGLLLPD